jgi:hypothetical protein
MLNSKPALKRSPSGYVSISDIPTGMQQGVSIAVGNQCDLGLQFLAGRAKPESSRGDGRCRESRDGHFHVFSPQERAGVPNL